MSGGIRQNLVTQEWVIMAPGRSKRPRDFAQDIPERLPRPEHDPSCPFCTGNESMIPPVLAEFKSEGETEWQTRIIPNRYPVLTAEGSISRYQEGIYIAMRGYGRHEVVIESPRHNDDIPLMSAAHLRTLVDAYHSRYITLCEDDRNLLILVFRNHGSRAGASLEHPHSQIITTGMVPRHIRWRELEAQRYHDEWGRCVYCDVLDFELRDQRRVVFSNRSYVAFVPYAADVPFEIWIMPRTHHSSFALVSDEEKEDLADALKEVLTRLGAKLNDPDYNYVINSSARAGDEPQLHWFVRIRPRLTTRAGFEIGTGIRINPSLPESDAAFLRDEA